MDRKELVEMIKLLNGEEGLLKNVGCSKIKVVGKGTTLEELKDQFRNILIKIDDAELIDEAPKACVKFFEDNLDEFKKGVGELTDEPVSEEEPEEEDEPEGEEEVEDEVEEEEPPKVEKPKKDKPKKEKAKANEASEFEELKEKIVARKNGNPSFLLEKLLLEGGDINEMHKKVSKLAESLEMKIYTGGVGEIRAFIKYREGRGWVFKKDGDNIELVDYTKPKK